ncbi:hypothetical protein GCM10009639_06540 [Kitasatospora putterlickiae]|uniref:Uncharacterized protein n=1 Tax=Kitasatospora putterlickiae TaxID=221725 RepID=A0ABN1XNJ2_9ACTN
MAEVGVGAGDQHRDPVGGAEVAPDLGEQAAAARVEGEDLPAGREQALHVVGPGDGERALLRGERVVGGARPGSVAFGGQRDPVGAVAHGERGAVEVADHQRVGLDQPVQVGGGEPAEELGGGGRRGGGRVGQVVSVGVVLDPGGAAGRRGGDGQLLGGRGGLGGHRTGVGEDGGTREGADQDVLPPPTAHRLNSLRVPSPIPDGARGWYDCQLPCASLGARRRAEFRLNCGMDHMNRECPGCVLVVRASRFGCTGPPPRPVGRGGGLGRGGGARSPGQLSEFQAEHGREPPTRRSGWPLPSATEIRR